LGHRSPVDGVGGVIFSVGGDDGDFGGGHPFDVTDSFGGEAGEVSDGREFCKGEKGDGVIDEVRFDDRGRFGSWYRAGGWGRGRG
jgi:hypothetical protein